MNRLTDLQRRAAHLLFELPEAAGFALAGGSALVGLGVVGRLTRDLDAFMAAAPADPPGDVRPLAAAFTAALTADGWTVQVVRDHVTFTRLLAEFGGEAIEIDLAVDSPPLFPLRSPDGIPSLGAEDLAARKILATLDRAEGRDFTDLWALSVTLGRDECIGWARQLDAGTDEGDIANAFTRLERIDEHELPCPPADRPAVRAWFAAWAQELRSTS